MQQQYILLNIEKLPEWCYLATSNQVQWLVAQWNTFEETIDIAHDLATILLKSKPENLKNQTNSENFVYPMLISI